MSGEDLRQEAWARAAERDARAAPRQPEGELEVVAWCIPDKVDRVISAEVKAFNESFGEVYRTAHTEPLCRLSDAQRAIAELREECEHLKACQENAMLHMTGLVAERDALRQQLAERDAEIMEQCRLNGMGAERELKLMTQRDKLAGLLREVRVIVAREVERWTRSAAILPVNANVESGLLTRIDAALAEVKPCPESLNPATT